MAARTSRPPTDLGIEGVVCVAKNDACDDGTWYQLGFPEPEREEYLALHAERPTEVGPADSRALLEGFDFLPLVSHSFSVSASARSS